MASRTKTWKIGEYMAGGVLTVEIKKDTVTIIQKEWDYSKGSRRSSDQSSAKELDRKSFGINNYNARNDMYMYLSSMTTSYYSEEVLDWIFKK